MARLRAPGGCPWDREQTFDSIKPYTLEETYEVLDAIDRRDWDELAEELGDFMLQAVFYAQMAAEQKLFRDRGRARRHQPEAGAPASARFRRGIGGDRPATSSASGAESRRRRRRQERKKPDRPAGRRAARTCRRWWKPSRSPRAPPAWASIGRIPTRCSRSCTRNWRSSPRRAATRCAGRTGRRTRRPAVRAGQPGALRQSRSRAGPAPHQRQVPQALRATSSARLAERGRKLEDSNIEEMEALWQEAKR